MFSAGRWSAGDRRSLAERASSTGVAVSDRSQAPCPHERAQGWEYAFPPRRMAQVMTSGESTGLRHRSRSPRDLTSDMRSPYQRDRSGGRATVSPGRKLLPKPPFRTGHHACGAPRADAQAQQTRSTTGEAQRGAADPLREEAIKLASIVEKETGLAAERPRIAAGSSIVSRPASAGIRPTISTAHQGCPLGPPLRQSELDPPSLQHLYIEAPAPDADMQPRAIRSLLC